MSKLDLRKKIVFIGMVQLVIVSGILFGLYFWESKNNARDAYVEKARSIVLTTEATREEMGNKWEHGVLTATQMADWAKAGDMEKIMDAIPIVTAMNAAAAKADEGGYQFRTPKFQPRNPKNQPDELESKILKMFEEQGAKEHYEFDAKMNAIRYFRPIRLTQECLLCHGDPAKSSEYWGNDQGLDPTGAKMENWKVGEVHGAFEVVQSLDEADAHVMTSLYQGGLTVAGLITAAAAAFFFLVTRSVVMPIRKVIQGLSEGAAQVNDAAAQVSSASQQAAANSSTAASSLEETSSALEEMAAMTRSNAENARQANELAGRARNSANSGDQTMVQLNTAMNAINDSSGEISKIIKVIEEIAFQTNLLALNAAVEAARAGEHGKGFAVVAEEVRNLAQRSAQAARDTTSLIASSVDRAKEGTGVAQEAAEALRAIVGDVGQVADLLNGISRASNEQSQGVDQINTAIGQLDKLTQQNAAGAEQTASASEQLTSMSTALKDQMVAELIRIVEGANKVR